MLATNVSLSKRGKSKRVTHNDDECYGGDVEERIAIQVQRLERSLLETQKKGDLFEESRLCNNIAKKYEQLQDWEKALKFHHYDKQISEAAGDIEGYLMAIGNMATVLSLYCHFESDILDILQLYRMGMEGLAKTMIKEHLKNALKHQNMPQAFIAHSEIGLGLLEEAADNAVGFIAKEKLSKASVSFFKAKECIDAFKAMIDAKLLSSTRIEEYNEMYLTSRLNEGRLSLSIGEMDAAIGTFQEALQIAKDNNEMFKQFEIFGFLGDAYGKLNEWNFAIEKCYDFQLALAKEMGEGELETDALLNLGLAYRNMRDFQLALRTLYLYKDRINLAHSDTERLSESENYIEETLELQRIAEKLTNLESKFSLEKSNKNEAFTLLKLCKYCERLSLFKDALSYAKEVADQLLASSDKNDTLLRDALLKAALLSIHEKNSNDAIFYSKRYLELEQSVEGCLMVSDSYWLLPTLPGEVLAVLRNAFDFLIPDTIDHLEVLSRLALCCQRLGLDTQYVKYREECLTIEEKLSSVTEGDDSTNKILKELEEYDYFVNRKASKNVMKLVDGQFNMKSRTRGTKGLEIQKKRFKRDQETLPTTTTVNNVNNGIRKKVVNRIIREDEIDDDLLDFIVDDDIEDYSKKSVKTEFIRKEKRDAAVIISDCDLPKIPCWRADDNFEDSPTNELIWPPSPKKTESTSLGKSMTWKGDTSCIASIIRVTVVINEESIIIPVVDDITERKSINWLCQEAKDRYLQEFEETPIIECLMTEDGGRLYGHDPVSLLLCDGQKVVAKINGFKGKSLEQLYLEECNKAGIMSDDQVTNRLSNTISKKVDLSFALVDAKHMELILNVIITNNSSVESLNLSSTDFTHFPLPLKMESLKKLDISFTPMKKLTPILDTFPNLEVLSANFCPIEDLNYFVFKSSQQEYPFSSIDISGVDLCHVNLGDWHYLPKLTRLSLAFCLMDEVTLIGIGELLRKTSSLKSLDISGCRTELIEVVYKALKVNCSIEEITLKGISTNINLMDLRNPRSAMKKLITN